MKKPSTDIDCSVCESKTTAFCPQCNEVVINIVYDDGDGQCSQCGHWL